jgi:hypothetical protein
MTTQSNTAAARAQVEQTLADSEISFVKRVSMTRGEKGRITGSVTQYVLDGHFVSDAFRRNYMKRTRVAKLQAEGLNVQLLRKNRATGEVILQVAA